MKEPALTFRQVRFTNTAFWRNPASAFFTFAFPLMFLVIFTALLGSGTVDEGTVAIPGVGTFHILLDQAQYFVGAMAAFGVISATYTNIAISVTFQRDSGILKRIKGTPLPGRAYLLARVVHAMFIATILVVITLAFGRLAYSAPLPTGKALLDFIVTLLVAGLSFSALGLAITSVIPNADAAPPIVNATILPLLFLSGIFIPLGNDAPQWIRTVSGVFPVRHFADAMRDSFLGNVTLKGTAIPVYHFHWFDIAVIAVWGIVGLVLAARFFTWEPRK